MKIAVIGTGYVGLVTGVCFSELGFTVTCVDKNKQVVEGLLHGALPIYEPGLKALLDKNLAAGRAHFTENIAEAVHIATIIFIAVGTPMDERTGRADLSYVNAAVDEVLAEVPVGTHKTLIVKSTVPVETCAHLQSKIDALGHTIDVVSNPEFLREGSAIDDFLKPDRIVCGVSNAQAAKTMQDLYAPLVAGGAPIVMTDPKTSELTKYAANSFLATKITFINEMSDLCEKLGANVQDISRGIGLDHRIGGQFLNVGPGYGGSCFPKDTRAVAAIGRDYEAPLTIVESVIEANALRKRWLGEKILKNLRESKGKIAILGVTFKAETDDMRDSPSLDVIPYLQEKGFDVVAYDPEGQLKATPLLPGVVWAEDAYAAMHGALAAVILTEWNTFKSLDMGCVKKSLKYPMLIDFRNLYPLARLEGEGIEYISLGRPVVLSSATKEIA